MEADVRGGILKTVGIILFAATCLYLMALYVTPYSIQKYEENKQNQQLIAERERERLLALTGKELVEMANSENDGIYADFLIDEIDFKLPFGCTGDLIRVDGGFEEKQYVITIPYADENFMLDKNVYGDLESISDILYEYDNHKGQLSLALNSMYEYTTDYDEDIFRFILISPKQIYNKIILIDAGAGETEEINRDIVIRLRELLKGEVENGIFYSGLAENEYRSSAESRLLFADDIEADYIISVQMNQTASHMKSAINGTQVAYQAGNEESMKIAEAFQTELVEAIDSSDKGIMEINADEVYGESDRCAVVIKPGFMTNKYDMGFMEIEENRQKIAESIYESLLSILKS